MKEAPWRVEALLRELATLAGSGMPLEQALGVCLQATRTSGPQRMITALRRDVARGHTLSMSMKRHPRFFSPEITGLITAGEQSGTLDHCLGELADYLESRSRFRAQLKSAVMYALAVLVVLAVSLSVIFSGFPLSPMLVLLMIAIGVIVVTQCHRLSNTFAATCDRLLLQLPIVGSLAENTLSARFARTFAMMYRAGVPPAQALHTVADVISNRAYKRAITSMAVAAGDGVSLSDAMRAAERFPEPLTQSVSIGENSGALDDMLYRYAEFSEEAIRHQLMRIKSLIEPILLCLLGLMLGGRIVASLM